MDIDPSSPQQPVQPPSTELNGFEPSPTVDSINSDTIQPGPTTTPISLGSVSTTETLDPVESNNSASEQPNSAATTTMSQIQPQPEGPVPQVFGMTGQPMGVPEAGPKSTKSKRGLKIALMALIVLVVIGGGTSLAYFKVVVPSKPENVLKSAFRNSLSQNSVTATITAEGTSTNLAAYKVQVTAKGNRSAKTFGADAKVTVTGVSVSGEVRYVDQSAFLKVNDLSNVTDLLGAISPTYKTQITSLTDKVTGKWFEIDSTILKQANADCTLNVDTKLTDGDYSIIEKAYQKLPFVTISSHEADTVSGNAATKYQLSIDDNKGADFFDGLNDLSVAKKLNECSKSSSSSSVTGDLDVSGSLKNSGLKDGDKTPLTVWVDKKTKLITKIAGQTTEKDKKDGLSASAEAVLDYSEVNIVKPEGAKPITSLLAELGSAFQNQPVLGAKIERLVP